MSWYNLITPKINKIMENYGLGTLIVVLILLCLDYYKVLMFSETKLSWIPHILWIYAIINLLAGSYALYKNNQNNPECPKCKTKLDIIHHYKCKKCGELDFKNLSDK